LRLLAIVTMVVLAMVGIGLLVLHTNPVQRRILDWSIRELERRFDLDLVADDLHFNLASRRVTMTNVRLAAVGHHAEPFFTANTVTVKLPWAAYRGRLRFDEVSIDSGIVSIARDAGGASNLPPGRGARDPNAPPRRIDIRGLLIQNLDFVYQDRRRDIEIRTPKIRTDMTYAIDEGVKGPIAIEHETLVRIRDRRVTVKPVTGTVVFDGSNVALGTVKLDTTDGLIIVNGSIERALDRPTLDLQLDGTTELGVSTRWAPPPIHISGDAAIHARMTGAPSAFTLDSRVTATSVQIGTESGVSIDAESRLTLDRIVVSRSIIRPGTGGEIQATVEVPFASDSSWWIKAAYRDIDAAAAFRLAEVRPLPFGAALSGNAVITRESGEPYRLEVHNTSTPRNARGTAPLDGRVQFVIDGNRWRAEQDHRMGSTHVAGAIGGTWNRQRATQSTFEPDAAQPLAVTTEDVAEAARYADLFGLAAPEIVKGTRGPMTAAVALSGTFTSPRFVGDVQSPGVDVPSLGTTVVKATFDASEAAFNATNIDATIGTTHVRGDVFANLATRTLGGTVEIESPNAADLLATMPETLRLEGPLEAKATLGGTVDAPDVVADVSGDELTIAGQPLQSLRATARVINGGVNLESLAMRQPGGGQLRGSGRYEWGSRTFTANIDGQDLLWRGTLARVGDAEVRVGLKFAGSGPIDRPTGEGAIEFAVTGGLAGALIDRGVANVRLNGDTALVTSHIPSLGAFITANITPQEPFNYDAVVVMNRIELAPMLTLAGLKREFVTGTASLSANATGTLRDIAGSNVFVNFQDLDAAVSDVPVRLVGPSRVQWDGSALTIDALDVSVGQGRLLASGRLGQQGISDARWESTFKGELGDLVKIGRTFGVPTELEGFGPVAAEWRSAGGLEKSTASVHLERASLAWAALPALRDLGLDATFDGATLNVAHFNGVWQDGSIEGTASIPRAVLEGRDTAGAVLSESQAGFAKLRVNGLTEAALAPWLNTASLAAIDGRLSATLDARITRTSIDGIAGSLVVDEADFTVAGVAVKQARPSIFEIAGGVVTARDVEFAAGGSPLSLTGTARLAPTDAQSLNLAIRGTADLQILSAFAPAIATDGEAKISVGIGGTLSTPVFNGRVDVAGAEVAIREPRIVISELTGTIAMDGQRVVFDAFNGTANGGRMTLDGGFLLEGFRPTRGGLVFVLERAALEYPQGLQSEANAIVTLQPSPTGWSLTGEVSVERSAYTAPISIAALIAARGMRPPAAARSQGWLEQLRLNIWVTTLQDLVVDNNYGRFEVGGALRVIGTVAEPVLAGRLTLNEGGEVYLAGNTFHIERGSISFTNPFRLEPEFDIQMRTLVGGTDLTLTLDGPLDRLRTDVRSSDPAVDSRQAMAMLFGGLHGEDAITLLSAELLGTTGRAIGLDTLRVERGLDTDEFRSDPGLIATVTDPATRLTLSKRLRPDVELILSQSLRESGGLSAILSYKPRRNIEVRAASRDNEDRTIALRHEITFGGPGTAGAGAAASAPVVSEVTISGNPGRTPEELLAKLELKPAERFDFHQWQRDIDTLRGVYHAENHYEVRVRGTRRQTEDGTMVALDYHIEPGPLTELVVEGHPLEQTLQDDIREAWRRTIFDRFLLEEIRTRIARHLIEEHVIGSKVDAVVALSTAERKQIRVTVNAGTHVTSRQVRYSGNTGYDADRLTEVIVAAGLDIDGWLDPRRIGQALENFYRSEGYLSATVKADQPVVAADVAELPVTIEEGPRYVIGSVSFPGVTPNRLAAVTAASRLEPKMPFVTTTVDEAEDRIETFYAAEGFNGVQIEVETEPDEAGATVAVTFAVLEGVQQILRDVTTQGATRTDEDVLRRALRLRMGAPVNLGDWSLARKRLYDTNVFRQVDIEPVPMEPTAQDSAAGIQPIRAVVRVVEYPVWRLRYGTQFSDELRDTPDADGDTRLQSLGVLADLQNQNLFGRAITAGIAGRYERSRQAASFFTSNSSFFGLPVRSSGFVFGSRQSTTDSLITTLVERVGITGEQRWRPSRTSEVLWSFRYERASTSSPDIELDLLPVRVSRLNAAVYFDRRDDPSDPTRGWFTSGNWEQAVQMLGSDYSNGKVFLQQALYRAIKRLTFAGRVQLGTGYGEESLIPSERFQLGGATTVRGYAENELGPQTVLGFPAGGDALLALNAEMRFPVRGWFQGVAFVDAGNVFAQRSELSFRDLAIGYGIGLRLASPFAMLRVDFGIPNRAIGNRPANQWSSGRWYFGVGHIF
jgi:outer membrane protein assembly complex protein YaeT